MKIWVQLNWFINQQQLKTMPALTSTKYEDDSGRIHPIALTPNYATAAGTVPAGAINDNVKPKVSKTKREFGIKPRGVRLSRTVGTAPNTFKKYAFLPVLQATTWAGAGFALGATVTINSIAWTVTARVAEEYN